MKLTDDDRGILSGESGPGAQKAMEILLSLGRIFEAEKMIPIESAQIAGVSYLNIGDIGLEFLKDWADAGARVSIPSFMNPAGIDRRLWKKMGISDHFARQQMEIISTLHRMGIEETLTCTPYHIGHVPKNGDHLAWSESSAVSFANSALGARTNREGGPSALAAAIIGKTPFYGLHLFENRVATHRINVKCTVKTVEEYNLLGHTIGSKVGHAIPYIHGLELLIDSPHATSCLKSLGAAMAASGSIALYHIDGITPEAIEYGPDLSGDHMSEITITHLDESRHALQQSSTKLQLVTLGCPHASLDELKNYAHLLQDVRVKIPLWITTSAHVYQQAEENGLLDIIERSGALVIADTCMVVAPLKYLGYSYIAVDSAKAACYLPSHQDATTYFGSTEQCIKSAREGKWIS